MDQISKKKQKISSGDPLFDLIGTNGPCDFKYVDSTHVMEGINSWGRCNEEGHYQRVGGHHRLGLLQLFVHQKTTLVASGGEIL